MQRKSGLLALAAMAAAGMASTNAAAAVPITKQDQYAAGFGIAGGQPYHGTAGMAYGTKTRGNRAVQRAATKKRNQQRHRKACRA